jgi:16S rRNA (guanine(966)-N(2))-methyltransferase RsmD
VRVIAGSARGVPLKGPPGPGTRATSDKVRGAIFDALAAEVPETHVLDLYAGTGALGIEALSRDAASCVFVEKSAAACRVIEANLRTTRLAERGKVWAMTVSAALERLETACGLPAAFQPPYDIILLDPPYGDPTILDVVERVSRSGLVARGDFVVLEHGKRVLPAPQLGALSLWRTRRYGDTAVTIWQHQG